ncbi:unnamed protein product [Toxocara canis]|uniref:Rx_N domain-containing protein n=1 Tax=Toxocara canis TaxID=6265 RepID=A0A183TZ21_TOXCA|nr:unnamed protein product [Toxocara canis]
MNEDSILHTLQLLHPKMEYQNNLMRRLELAQALKELADNGDDLSYLSAEMRELLDSYDKLHDEALTYGVHLDRLIGIITDLYIVWKSTDKEGHNFSVLRSSCCLKCSAELGSEFDEKPNKECLMRSDTAYKSECCFAQLPGKRRRKRPLFETLSFGSNAKYEVVCGGLMRSVVLKNTADMKICFWGKEKPYQGLMSNATDVVESTSSSSAKKAAEKNVRQNGGA